MDASGADEVAADAADAADGLALPAKLSPARLIVCFAAGFGFGFGFGVSSFSDDGGSVSELNDGISGRSPTSLSPSLEPPPLSILSPSLPLSPPSSSLPNSISSIASPSLLI